MRVRNLTTRSFHLIVVNAVETPIGGGEVRHEGFVVVRKTTEVKIKREEEQGSLTVQMTTEAALPNRLTRIHGGGGNGIPIDETDGDGNQIENQLKIRNETTQTLPFEVKDENRAVVDADSIEIDDFFVFDAADIAVRVAGGTLSLEIWMEIPPLQ